MPEETRGAAIVQGLISLGHALGLSVVGEGVETAAQAEALKVMGCELGQGYYFAYPGTPKQLWAASASSESAGAAAFPFVPRALHIGINDES